MVHSKPSHHVLQHSKSLLTTGRDSDLILSAAGRHFNLHHLLVCHRSPFFEASCRFKKNANRLVPLHEHENNLACSIDLTSDDPNAIACLVHFLYTDDYELSEILRGIPADDTDALRQINTDPVSLKIDVGYGDCNLFGKDVSTGSSHFSRLALHASVYGIAECYGVLELEPLALQKFRNAIPRGAALLPDVGDFLTAVRIAYESTSEGDADLRTAIAETFYTHRVQLLQLDDAKNLLIKNGYLGRDLALQSVKGQARMNARSVPPQYL